MHSFKQNIVLLNVRVFLFNYYLIEDQTIGFESHVLVPIIYLCNNIVIIIIPPSKYY